MASGFALPSDDLSQLIEASPAPLLLVGFDGLIKQCNTAAARLLGAPREELRQAEVARVIYPADREMFLRDLARLAESGRGACLRYRFRHGSRVHRVRWCATPFQDKRWVFVVAHEIGRRERRHEERYRRVFEAAKDGLLVLDGRSGVILDANARLTEITGYAAGALIGKKIGETPPFQGSGVATELLETLRERDTYRLEETLMHRERGGVECELVCNTYSEAGRPRIQCTIRDIAKRKRAEAAQRETEERWRALVEGLRDHVVLLLDPDGNVVNVSGAGERILGYSEDEIAGRPVALIFTSEDAARGAPRMELKKAAMDGHADDERWHVRKDGTRFYAAGVVTPLWHPDGRLRGFAKVMRDITDKKHTDEAMRESQKLESIGLLAGGVAHDFNNLLTGILGNASLALEDVPPRSPARPLLQEIVDASKRAGDMTRQLLAYAGKGRVRLERFNISRAVSEILDLIHASIPEEVELRLELQPNLPAIEADPTQIQQVAMNLAINAAESIDGAGRVRIATGRKVLAQEGAEADDPAAHLAPGEYVVLEVEDNGTGMDEETRTKIFEPFFTTKFTGRGLGLAAVAGIVRSHRGAIQVLSAPGEGSTFRVFFPAVHHPAEWRSEAEMTPVKGSGTILVVDDEEVVRRISREGLERQGYNVITAADGREAVERFREQSDRIALVVLDMAMPVMSGQETFRELKQIRPDVPIVVASGYSEMMAAQRFGPSVMQAFIQKPYSGSELARQVHTVLNRDTAF